jgi:hypothetical protein
MRGEILSLIKTAEVKTFQELISEPEGRIWKAKERPVYREHFQ